MLPLLLLTLEALFHYLHTLFNKYLDHLVVKFEQNRTVLDIHNFELFWQKWLTIFEKVLMPFRKTFL